MQEIKYFQKEGNNLRCNYGNEVLLIEPHGINGIRVRSSVTNKIETDLPSALISDLTSKEKVKIVIDKLSAILSYGLIEARVAIRRDVPNWVDPSGADVSISFFRTDTGKELLKDRLVHPFWPASRYFRPIAGDLYRLEARFEAYDDEKIFGLGQQQHGLLDQKGCVVELMQQNSMVSIPFALSSRGYGFLWNNPGIGRVEFAENGTRWIAEGTKQLDYWITAADTPQEIVGNYVAATGFAPVLPEWASGFWQCKLRYSTQEEVLSVAREYKRRNLPISVIVIDYFHWTKQGEWKLDPKCWPDPKAMVKELEELGIRVMISIWPTVNSKSEEFRDMLANGFLLRNERGVSPQMSFIEVGTEGREYLHYYDATNPEARKYHWSKVKKGYFDNGIDIFWVDACEPDIYPYHPEDIRYYAGEGRVVANLYPLCAAQAICEGRKSSGAKEETVLLCRSTWAGGQRYGVAVWSGDIHSSFKALRLQIPAGLNIGISGIPWWTTDIGGFMGGDIRSPEFRELVVRWFQYAVFCPLFRLHGYRATTGTGETTSGDDNEVWSFGEEAYKYICKALNLREKLRPYIMGLMKKASSEGTPPMRPLFMEFPQDSNSWKIEDQFMFGEALLVAPITEYQGRKRMVYLPEGAKWINAYDSSIICEGGQTVSVSADLDHIPVFVREGHNSLVDFFSN